MSRSARGLPLPLALAGLLAACTVTGSSVARYEPGYAPDRRDYKAFLASHAQVIDPNYLPFMVHRFRAAWPHRLLGAGGEGDLLVLCRWPDEAMPLAVYVEEPAIPDALQSEFHPVPPRAYVDAVGRALAAWEAELEGLVRFRLVHSSDEAALSIHVRGERAPAPDPDRLVLGHVQALAGACRVDAGALGSDPLPVRFAVPELHLYLAHEFGLLTPNQLERVALHEIGHALGMMGHSPLDTDLMYREGRERLYPKGLAIEDVNSFVSLYRLPNGTVFARVPQASRPPPSAAPPPGPPLLSQAPHVDARYGFEIRPPSGWLRMEGTHGFFAANGPSWDHDASLEVVRFPDESAAEFLDRFGPGILRGKWLRHRAWIVVNGRNALRIALEDAEGRYAEEFTLVELGGSVLMVLAQCPAPLLAEWQPWFRASLASLEIW